jgi:hypothetical protein
LEAACGPLFFCLKVSCEPQAFWLRTGNPCAALG